MEQPNHQRTHPLKDTSAKVVRFSPAQCILHDARHIDDVPLPLRRSSIEQTLREIPDGVLREPALFKREPIHLALSTARIIITAEERVRTRLHSALRVALATVFLGISGLISLGANVTTAFAKKVSPEKNASQADHLMGAAAHLKGAAMPEHSNITRLGRSNTPPKGIKHHHGLKFYRHSARLHHGMKSLVELAPFKVGPATRHDSKNAGFHGIASWYGREFNNRRTASGVRFNTHAMMAAHRTLPFGTKVRVTNLHNHKSCVVEITDRGPYAYNRVIDLSYAAAEQLDMTEAGTAEVELQVLGAGPDYQDIASGTETIAFSKDALSVSNDISVLGKIPGFPDRSFASMLNVTEAEAMDQSGR
ncbi:MAG TPA: septal ring lytic transglycosylase RlpA family protein [Candidatus Kapabacteria bacterium]|jgi:rare lipoprotein A|nr:septal ring lytic transglycosylase RlpA family protein [Candidatus Kapabacteria bacterium]